MAKPKPVRRRAPKKATRRMSKQSVALVKRSRAASLKRGLAQAIAIAQTPFEQRVVTDGFALDSVGLVTLKTDARQEKILSRTPADDQISVLPDGALYCSHPVYTMWLNDAFGRGGWSLVPVSKPAIIESTVTVKYILYIDGKPIALADGKQEYHASNKNQDYGDVLEATRSNALRRAAKHLGIALQLWDKRWCLKWRREHCVQVTVAGRKKTDEGWVDADVTQWRRRDDEPLPKEKREGRASRREPPTEEHAKLDEPISKEKRERFWRIARRVGRNEDAIKRWLKTHYHIETTEQIKNRDYDTIVRILESPGELSTGTRHVHQGELVHD